MKIVAIPFLSVLAIANTGVSDGGYLTPITPPWR